MRAPKNLQEFLSLGILITYLFLFPFGQLLKQPLLLENRTLNVNLIDFVVFSTIPIFFIYRLKIPKVANLFLDFIYIGLFSLGISLGMLSVTDVLFGSFYLIRLLSFLTFFVVVQKLCVDKVITPKVLINAIILTLFVSGLFGWMQFLLFPDLVDLKYIGWDDHLYRLTGTFLDPGFTGILMVFASLIAVGQYISNKKIFYLVITAFFIATAFFTYSRASYLALFGGIITFLLKGKIKIKIILPIFAGIIISLFLLPRMASEGTILERTGSIIARIANYRQTAEIIYENPLFGVGFNNLCEVRFNKFNDDIESNACAGSDSSLMFILATTGVVGLLVFISIVYKIYSYIGKQNYPIETSALIVALFVHSLFVQSAFYIFVMGFFAIIFAANIKAKDSN